MFAPDGPAESSANAVLFPFGSPNATGVGSLCFVSYGMIAPHSCFGEVYRNLAEDIDHADLALVWGANPATASPPENLVRLKQLQARGGRVVVIDPRRSETARALRAEWVGIRPGTDGALALGMLHVLIAEGLYDRAFVRRFTHGFDELAAYAEAFTPERVEAITGVPADTVRELARAVGYCIGLLDPDVHRPRVLELAACRRSAPCSSCRRSPATSTRPAASSSALPTGSA